MNHDGQMSLRYGDLVDRPTFASEDERREAWFAHRDELMRDCGAGQRPAGWWDFESPIPRPRDRDYAAAALYEAGLLTDDEASSLTARWLRDFARAQAPGFAYCAGFAKPSDTTATWLKGAAARRAHYRWAGIPRALIREWTAQRRHRGRTIAR